MPKNIEAGLGESEQETHKTVKPFEIYQPNPSSPMCEVWLADAVPDSYSGFFHVKYSKIRLPSREMAEKAVEDRKKILENLGLKADEEIVIGE